MTIRAVLLLALLGVSGCSYLPNAGGEEVESSAIRPATLNLPTPEKAADNFLAVVDQVEPVAERLCRAEAPAGVECDFQIVVDSRPNMPANVFQTLDPAGRPIVVFTIALIAQAKNRDELAFILGFEAGRHIAGQASGPDAPDADISVPHPIQVLGEPGAVPATDGAAEMQADALATLIAHGAGYDARTGAAYFTRAQAPGNLFLAAHPDSGLRMKTVELTLGGLE